MNGLKNHLPRRRWWVVGAVLLATSGWFWQHRFQARQLYLQQQLLHGPHDQAILSASELASTAHGRMLLIEPLLGDDPQTARRISTLLIEMIDGWTLHADGATERKLDAVAAALTAYRAEFSPPGREAAIEVALRILTWHSLDKGYDRTQRTSDCEAMLAMSTKTAVPGENEPIAPVLSPAVPSPAAPASEGPLLVELADLPGGGLPIVPAGLPDAMPELAPAPHDEEPRLLSAAATQGQLITTVTVEETPTREEPALAEAESRSEPTGRSSVIPARLSQAFDQLGSGDEEVVLAAHRELGSMGLSPAEVQIAADFASPDPAVREKLVQVLPRIPGVDAKPWLLWLSHDSDAKVRLAAVTLMATSGDADMLQRIAEIAQLDTDLRVQSQAHTALRHRR